LKDKVIWITGACGGLGKNFCKAFLGEGASICLTDIDEDLIADTLREFDAAEKMMGAVVDVCRRSTIEASVSRMVAHFGKLDALVNVAGGSLYTPNKFEDIDEGSWDKVVDVNLKGTFLCSQAAAGQFRKQGRGGKIVNVSALAGRWLGSLAGCHYTAAKAGVIGLTRHLAYELGPEGIYVNAIAPTITFASQRTVDLWNKRSPEYRDRGRRCYISVIRRSQLYNGSDSGHQWRPVFQLRGKYCFKLPRPRFNLSIFKFKIQLDLTIH
jgi:NAD(P)-dependent dehydrogenase (short-subunit alcohol dehydrogenase family)